MRIIVHLPCASNNTVLGYGLCVNDEYSSRANSKLGNVRMRSPQHGAMTRVGILNHEPT